MDYNPQLLCPTRDALDNEKKTGLRSTWRWSSVMISEETMPGETMPPGFSVEFTQKKWGENEKIFH